MANSFLDDEPAEAGPEITGSSEPVMEQYEPPSNNESVRRSGLAWSAGIVFFGAIVFMLFLGWIGDQLLGTSPWGLVGGIVLGSIIGFVQFFRISSQIYDADKSEHKLRPLLSQTDDGDDERG